MDLLNQLEMYINAQKNVGIHFILIGAGLLLIAGLSHFLSQGSLSNGLKTGALICGLLIIAGGFGYRNTETKLLKTQTELYEKNQTEFQKKETERMEKVMKGYPIYQIVFGGFVVLALLVVWFVKNPYWHGVAFAAIILFVGVMIVEAFSHQSIKSYFEILKNKVS